MTRFRCLNGSIGVRSICNNKGLVPGPDFADDGRQLMARTMFCGCSLGQSYSRNALACNPSHLEKHPEPYAGKHETTNTCEDGHPPWHLSRLDVELGSEIEPCSGKKTTSNRIAPEKIIRI